MPKPVRILLTGGGSGGHIIPNLAVASALRDENPEIQLLYVCSRKKLDADILKKTAIPFVPIFSGKWRRYFSWQNFIDPFLFFIGLIQSFIILLRFRPQVLFSKGGYVSLPLVCAAFLLRKKVVLHESDSRMGLANRLASKLASVVCVTFPEMAKTHHYRLTGNPIRPDIIHGDAEKGYELTGFNSHLPVLLVWGGSQGAIEINNLIEQQFEAFVEHFQIIHITGADKTLQKKHPHYVHFPYLDDTLKHIYAITTIVIGRAGSNSLFEIAALQKPHIMIPLSNPDQLGNAAYFERKGAGIIYYPATTTLFDLTWDLWQNKNLQTTMKQALSTLYKNNASADIATLILNLVMYS